MSSVMKLWNIVRPYLPLAIQFAGALILGFSQYFKMLETLQGVSLAMFLSFEVFLFLNLGLAFRAYRDLGNSETKQLIATYLLWIVMITLDLYGLHRNGSYRWSLNDSITISIAGFGLVACHFGARAKGLRLTDPIVRGIHSCFFKAVPQVALGVKIFCEGGNGTPALAIFAGHVTIGTRIFQIIRSIKDAGGLQKAPPAVKGIFISEAINWASWVIVTIIWIIRKLDLPTRSFMINWLSMYSDTIIWCGVFGGLAILGFYSSYREAQEKSRG